MHVSKIIHVSSESLTDWLPLYGHEWTVYVFQYRSSQYHSRENAGSHVCLKLADIAPGLVTTHNCNHSATISTARLITFIHHVERTDYYPSKWLYTIDVRKIMNTFFHSSYIYPKQLSSNLSLRDGRQKQDKVLFYRL